MKALIIAAILGPSDPAAASDRSYAALSELLKAEPDCTMMGNSCVMCALGPNGMM
jgi:hypothetical protein